MKKTGDDTGSVQWKQRMTEGLQKGLKSLITDYNSKMKYNKCKCCVCWKKTNPSYRKWWFLTDCYSLGENLGIMTSGAVETSAQILASLKCKQSDEISVRIVGD